MESEKFNYNVLFIVDASIKKSSRKYQIVCNEFNRPKTSKNLMIDSFEKSFYLSKNYKVSKNSINVRVLSSQLSSSSKYDVCNIVNTAKFEDVVSIRHSTDTHFDETQYKYVYKLDKESFSIDTVANKIAEIHNIDFSKLLTINGDEVKETPRKLLFYKWSEFTNSSRDGIKRYYTKLTDHLTENNNNAERLKVMISDLEKERNLKQKEIHDEYATKISKLKDLMYRKPLN